MNHTPSTRPQVTRYQLFGMGHRRKLVYQAGVLRDAHQGEPVAGWQVDSAAFEPDEYRVTLRTNHGEVVIDEDEEGVWVCERGDRRCLSRCPVRLPRFDGHPHAALLRALHAELLVNVMPWGPVPNLWVYPRPWYRDAAMMAMGMAMTENIGLLEPWIAGLRRPFDYNNAGAAEPDNLGQVLYLLSLIGGRTHELVDRIIAEAKAVTQNGHLAGQTDSSPHPVYQTKWLKYGLRSLGLDDSSWTIPMVRDNYSALFWMDYRDQHMPMERHTLSALRNWPYLNWAEAHFYGEPAPESPTADTFPLSREILASEGLYHRMKIVSEDYAKTHWASPHTWHAVEMFLYLLDPRVQRQTVE